MPKIELKPCPFCGGKVMHYHTNYIDLNNKTHAFKCKRCGTLFYIPTNLKYVSEEKTEKEAAEAWNRRYDND